MLLFAVVAALACQPDPARRTLPAMGRDARAFIPKGWTQESLHQPDLNGDGTPDRVLIIRDADVENRRLLAAIATPRGFRNVGEASLPGYPLGEASVTFSDKGVLVVEDLTGGTTATAATMRYRFDAASGGMRYVGLDLTNYSRTNQHDAIHFSYNWLTGDRVKRVDRLTKRGDYAPQKAQRRKGAPQCWFMEDTADPEDLLSAGMDGVG